MDISRDYESFVLRMCSVVTHLVLESICMTNQTFLTPFNANTQQNGVLLREIVYILLTVRELLSRLMDEGKAQELAEFMLSKLSSDVYEHNALK